jgi:thioredoxin reductase
MKLIFINHLKYMFRITITALACYFLAPIQSRAQKKFDVVIYGGTSSGITAAIQAAKMGKRVILIEPGNHLGGMAVEGLGGTDIDDHPEFQNSIAVGGLVLEFYKRIAIKYNRSEEFSLMINSKRKEPGLWRFESHMPNKYFVLFNKSSTWKPKNF